MTFALRPSIAPDDYQRIAEMANTAGWDPTSVEAIAAGDGAFPADGLRLRLVATDPSGYAVGYGWVQRMPYDDPGDFAIRVVVDPERREQGVGSALLAALEGWARERGARRFQCEFRDDHPEWLSFVVHRGYVEEGHHFGAQLDLEAFDEAPFAGEVTRLEAEGIRFMTMADPHDEELERSVWAMQKAANADEPGCEDEPFPPFEEWRKDFLEHELCPRDLFIVAVDGERAVGLTAAARNPKSGNVNTRFTGVDRDYRGRGIALAVKVLLFRAARRYGAKWTKTGSDSRNAPMLAINRKLGYVYMPGMYKCSKTM
ncbi:MAG TPA: GNAT family N-acetyltransferase [Symbiobacteriaceae bacterium]|nr:GNAT family N-acetyltransferase [Symbiobacteriaceae bacterium]